MKTDVTLEDLWDDDDVDMTGFYDDAAHQQAQKDIERETTEEPRDVPEQLTNASRKLRFNNIPDMDSKWDKYKM